MPKIHAVLKQVIPMHFNYFIIHQLCVWNVPRGMLLVARSSLSCLIWSTHTPCVPSSKSICCCCCCAHTFLKLFFTKHFVVAPRSPSPSLSLRCFCWQPWPSLWHLVSCELSLSLFLCLSPSPFLSQPFTHSLHGLLWLRLCVCACVFGAYVCIISAAIRAASAYTSCSPSCLLLFFFLCLCSASLPFHVSFSCFYFSSLSLFFQVQSW